MLLVCSVAFGQNEFSAIKIKSTPTTIDDQTKVDVLVREKSGPNAGMVRKVTWDYLASLFGGGGEYIPLSGTTEEAPFTGNLVVPFEDGEQHGFKSGSSVFFGIGYNGSPVMISGDTSIETGDGAGVGLTSGSVYTASLKTSNLTTNKSFEFPNSSGTIPMSVSVNGGTPATADTAGNINITVSGAATNLTGTASGTNYVVTNTNGTGFTLNGADGTNSGLLLPGQYNKLNNLDANANATYAPKASPTFTGTPTAPTATAGTNNTQIATTAFAAALGATKQDAFGSNVGYPYTNGTTTTFVSAGSNDLIMGNGTSTNGVTFVQNRAIGNNNGDGSQLTSTTMFRKAAWDLQVQLNSMTAYSPKTANYTLTSTDYCVDLTANSATFTLPTAVGVSGKQYVVKNSGSGTTLTLATTSSQTIDGTTTKTFNTQFAGCRVISDGANWKIIGTY